MDFVKIKPEDFETLAELQKAYKAEIGEAEPADAELESLKQAIGAGRIQFYGCLCGGALVACCSVCETYSTFHYGRSGVLEDFYIRPAYRGRGLSRRLLEECIGAAKQIGYCHMRLDTLPFMTAAMGLYKAYGFYEIPPYYDNPIPAVFLQKDL